MPSGPQREAERVMEQADEANGEGRDVGSGDKATNASQETADDDPGSSSRCRGA